MCVKTPNKRTGKYTTPITFHVTPEQKKALAHLSIDKDLSVSHMMRRMVVKKLEKAKTNGNGS